MSYRGLLSCIDARRCRALVPLLALLLFLEPVSFFTASAQVRQKRRAAPKIQEMTSNQKIEQVLTRLGFGPRPGDFGRVKAMGVEAYIAQQLNPDSIDDSALEAKLGKLGTLGLPTPALMAIFNPPKPAPTPTPKPAPSPLNQTAPQVAPKTAQPQAVATAIKEQGTAEAKPVVAAAAERTEAQKPAGEPAKKNPAQAAKPPAKPPQPPNPQTIVSELQRAAFLRAVYSERQLDEMMVEFWENHFSIFAQKDSDRFLLTSFDRDVIRPFSMGRFRDLLGATAHSPAMLYYLDNWQSSVVKEYPAANGKPARKTGGVNENYARELMELHTMGVDGGYTQKDVQEVARCLTGWTIQKPNDEGLFVYNPTAHDRGAKVVLGHKIPAGGGITDGERVLDILATHPSTARFIATKLARRFISDNPPASVVSRAADIFLKTDGSIRETLRAIITSPEFFSSAAYRAKVRSPFEYAAAAVRGLNAETDGDRPILDWVGRMGQPIFGRLTPDGYGDQAERWLSTGALLDRFNFANALATNRIKGTKVDLSALLGDVDKNDPDAVTASFVETILSGDITANTKAALEKIKTKQPEQAAQKIPPASNALTTGNVSYAPKKPPVTAANAPPAYFADLVTLIIGAPEFQRR
jgi:uncharacterized protein (DUF1800 family)